MKKRIRILTAVISAMLIFAMLVTNASAAAFSLDFMRDQITSYEGTYTASAVLKKPLLIFEDMPEIKQFEIFGPDYAKIVESLLGSSAVMNIKASMTPDYKKAEIYYDMAYNIPLELCEKLKITTDMSMKYWLSYDFTDLENPQLKIIYDIPLAKKYVYFDYADLAAQDETVGVMLSKVLDRDLIKDYTEKFAAIIEENAAIEKKSTGYTIKFDDAGVKNLFAEYFGTVAEMIGDMLGEEEAKSVLDELKLPDEIFAIANVQLFGEDGLTIDVILDRYGKIREANYVIDLDFNLVDVISAINESAVPAWMTREKADIAVAFKFAGVYDKVNKNITVQFPELTEENSYNPFDLITATEEIAPYNNEYYYLDTDKFVIKDSFKIYYSFREAVKDFEMDDSTITYDKGVLTFENTNDRIDVKKIQFAVGDTKLIVDGEETVLEVAPINQGGTVYVTRDFLNKAFKAEGSDDYENISLYDGNVTASSTFHFPLSKNFVAPENGGATVATEKETVVSFNSDAVEIIDNAFYIPVDVIFNAFSDEYDIEAFKSTVEYAKDSDKVKVSGTEFTLEAPVIEIDGIPYADTSFIEIVFFADMLYGDYSINDNTLYCDFLLTAKG